MLWIIDLLAHIIVYYYELISCFGTKWYGCTITTAHTHTPHMATYENGVEGEYAKALASFHRKLERISWWSWHNQLAHGTVTQRFVLFIYLSFRYLLVATVIWSAAALNAWTHSRNKELFWGRSCGWDELNIAQNSVHEWMMCVSVCCRGRCIRSEGDDRPNIPSDLQREPNTKIKQNFIRIEHDLRNSLLKWAAIHFPHYRWIAHLKLRITACTFTTIPEAMREKKRI